MFEKRNDYLMNTSFQVLKSTLSYYISVFAILVSFEVQIWFFANLRQFSKKKLRQFLKKDYKSKIDSPIYSWQYFLGPENCFILF